MRYHAHCAVTALLSVIVPLTTGLAMTDESPRTCVIGAGYSGLATARYLSALGVNFTVFEASRHVGGTWYFDPHVGTDEDGLPVYTSQYKYLRTNTPRQTMEFAGFPFPAETPTYPAGTCFYKYLLLFTKHYDLSKYIQLRSVVTAVRWARDHWDLSYTNTATGENRTERCGFVVVANGHQCRPNYPKFDGQDSFKGKIMHSHDYKAPEPFKGRRVLLVGAGASGLDLATHLSNLTARLVHSHHLNYVQPRFSDSYVKKPDIKAFTANGVIFEDDTFEEIDDVIFCTGFVFDHPFLDADSGVTVSERFVLPLYQHVVNIRHPSMTFVGISKAVINRVLDTQAEYVASLAAGNFKLPSREQMLKSWLTHVYAMQANGFKIVDVNIIGNEMDNYFRNLTEEAGVTRAPPVLKEIRDFNAKNRLEDLLNYRDYDYEIINDTHYRRFYNPRPNVLEYCPINL